jgi:hypothetical protein
MSVSARVEASVHAEVIKIGTTGQPSKSPIDLGATMAFINGTTALAVDRAYAARLTLAASANQDIDLAGALENELGETVVFAKIKVILLRHVSGVNSVILGGAAATQFQGPFGAVAHTLVIPPSGVVLLARQDTAGWAVGAGTADFLRVANSAAGTPVTFDLVILGTSA